MTKNDINSHRAWVGIWFFVSACGGPNFVAGTNGGLRDADALPKVPVELTLTVNGVADSLAISADSVVRVAWASKNASSCEITGNGEKWSTLSDEQDTRVSSDTDFVAVCKGSDEDVATKRVTVSVDHNAVFLVGAGQNDKLEGAHVSRPLAVYFVVDITGSMAIPITTIKDGIREFVDRLKEKNYEPRIGMIPFRDDAPRHGVVGESGVEPFDLSADVDAFKAYVSSLEANGGGDAEEAALMGVEYALTDILTFEKRPDALKVVFVTTDYPGHHGAVGTPRDCSLTTTLNRFQSLPASDKKLVKFFYATDVLPDSCGGFTTAESQMQTLLGSMFSETESPLATRGGKVSWPLDKPNDLVTTFADMIDQTAPDIDLTCINQSVAVYSGAEKITDWSASNLVAVFQDYKSSGKHAIRRDLGQADVDRFKDKDAHLTATAHRCCVSNQAAANADFSKCLLEKDVTGIPVEFTEASPVM